MDLCKLLTGEELFACGATKNEAILPTRGVKYVIPSHSWLENKQVQCALEERKNLLAEERIEKHGSLTHAEWIPELHKARVLEKKGSHWSYLGHVVNGTIYLYPEETLLLMEMNHLYLYFGNVLVSLQQAYSMLLEKTITINEYKVYSSLCRLGYKLKRTTNSDNKSDLSLSENKAKKNTRIKFIDPPSAVIDLNEGTTQEIDNNKKEQTTSEINENPSSDKTVSSTTLDNNNLCNRIDLVDNYTVRNIITDEDSDIEEIVTTKENVSARKIINESDNECEIIEKPSSSRNFREQIFSIEAIESISDSDVEETQPSTQDKHRSESVGFCLVPKMIGKNSIFVQPALSKWLPANIILSKSIYNIQINNMKSDNLHPSSGSFKHRKKKGNSTSEWRRKDKYNHILYDNSYKNRNAYDHFQMNQVNMIRSQNYQFANYSYFSNFGNNLVQNMQLVTQFNSINSLQMELMSKQTNRIDYNYSNDSRKHLSKAVTHDKFEKQKLLDFSKIESLSSQYSRIKSSLDNRESANILNLLRLCIAKYNRKYHENVCLNEDNEIVAKLTVSSGEEVLNLSSDSDCEVVTSTRKRRKKLKKNKSMFKVSVNEKKNELKSSDNDADLKQVNEPSQDLTHHIPEPKLLNSFKGWLPNVCDFGYPLVKKTSNRPKLISASKRTDFFLAFIQSYDSYKLKKWASLKAVFEEKTVKKTVDSSQYEDCVTIDCMKPLIQPEFCKNVTTVLEKLQIIKPACIKEYSKKSDLKIIFNVYMPAMKNIKKENIYLPRYGLVCLSNEKSFPSTEDISDLHHQNGNEVPLLFAVVGPNNIHYMELGIVNLPPIIQQNYNNFY